MKKVGVGIITYNREKYFEQVLESLNRCKLDNLVVVNDGTPYKTFTEKGNLIQHDQTRGVAVSKNDAIKYLIERGCDHLFIIEDDILIKDQNVFNKYIELAECSGMYHLNFEQVGQNQLRFNLTYEDSISAAFYKNPQGAFSYFFKNLVRKMGLLNENYKNAFEHIEYAYRLSRAGLLPPFWYFPDVQHSEELLQPIEGSIENSTITGKDMYQENWNASAQYFIKQHGHFTSNIPDIGSQKALSSILQIQKTHGNLRDKK